MSGVPCLEALVIVRKNSSLHLGMGNTKDNELLMTFDKILNINTAKSLQNLLL